MSLVKLILAFICPPLSVALHTENVGQVILNIILTFLGWIPGLLHALFVMATVSPVKK